MAALDLDSLKAYVGGGAPRALPSSTVLLDIVHSLIQQRFVEIPFDLHSTVEDVKAKVYQLTGSSPAYQQLHLGGPAGPLLNPSHATLYSFPQLSGGAVTSLYVEDLDPHALGRGGGLHDVSGVKKYVMSDEDYRKRENTYRAFKMKQKEKDPAWRSIYEGGKKGTGEGGRQGGGGEGATEVAETEAEVRSRIPLHTRCQITPGERRGTVECQRTTTTTTQHSTSHSTQSFCPLTALLSSRSSPVFGLVCALSDVGLVPELRVGSGGAPLIWVGVALDEPMGKHSGEVGGHRYFTCTAKHGSFIRPTNVVVGDFPERDPFEDDDEEDKGEGTAKESEGGADAALYEEI